MPHRILQIIPSLDRGGAEKQMLLLAAGLPRDAFEVHVCALTRGGPLADDLRGAGIPLTVIGKRWKLDPLAYWRLEQHVRSLQPDLVQTWLFAGNAYGRAAARRSGVPVIVASERCVDPWKQGYQHAIDRYLAQYTAALVVNSTGVREFYQRHGIPPELFRLIPNGVELPIGAPSSGQVCAREALLQQLGLPASSKLIAAVGRLWPQKRVKDLIWATDLLKVIRDDVHLLVIGDGPQRAALERYRHLCRIESHVHFLGLRSDVSSLLPHCDLLWLASEYEGMPNVVLEAMAAGIPVVATNIPGTRDLVVPNETGFLVTVGERADFARYANQLLDDPELARRLGSAGRARVAESFTARAMIDRFAALYRELLESRHGSA